MKNHGLGSQETFFSWLVGFQYHIIVEHKYVVYDDGMSAHPALDFNEAETKGWEGERERG